MFGRTVGASYGTAGDPTDRTNVDDTARLILAHRRDDRAGNLNGTKDVGLKVTLDLLAAIRKLKSVRQLTNDPRPTTSFQNRRC